MGAMAEVSKNALGHSEYGTCSVPTPHKIADEFLALSKALCRRNTFFRQVNMEYLRTSCKLRKYSILSRV
jgi:hypothetical protein